MTNGPITKTQQYVRYKKGKIKEEEIEFVYDKKEIEEEYYKWAYN